MNAFWIFNIWKQLGGRGVVALRAHMEGGQPNAGKGVQGGRGGQKKAEKLRAYLIYGP